MRKLNFIVFLFCANHLLISQTKSRDIEVVLSHMQNQEESWNRGDIAGLMVYYWNSDSLKFIGKEGVNYGWNKTKENYLKKYPTKEAMGTLRFTVIEASQICSESVFIIGKWELSKEKPTGGHFTLLWRKIRGNWLIVADHTS